MTRGKEAAVVLKSIQLYDGEDTVSNWSTDIRSVWGTRQAGGEQRTYERVQAHAKSLGLDVILDYEYRKLKVTVIIK